ncbi:MAG TPA: CPBP family intramembrane metalloprotease [Candidatus Thiothrix moscowensis]|uniref:CPBP family intramembrane glutamic endopeptidase n=1 Tax=unclassified Thiothrix TaxID=2636184 RepID=UPI001A22E870|nr:MULTISPECIES: CPBP family intramembrane glutamic endopeptidase [unclassified Thiothrix]MBJ6608798.1 CPBP family intramembrane metalloprotease [Candidatus Thiothrix moscowensis]HRJ51772.1 CPBP family intramembrane metalloprotease [Candidatus Thiothrix moscowensis]HRJ92087.1 CPBP family intramembrane metalloprotease [Candidatus Thiothrix moscowensis]
MKQPAILVLQKFLNVLQEIHQESVDRAPLRQPTGQWDSRPAIALMVIAICLLMLHYLKFATTYQVSLAGWFSLTADNPQLALQQFRNQPFFSLLGEAWWSLWHLVCFILIPVLVIKLVFRESLANYGLGIGKLRQHFKWYLLLTLPILCFVVIVSFRDDFSNHYPFYRLANRSWADLLAWELLYLSQFVCVEFFFRGFILQACRPAFGVNAIFVMIVPYLMIHFSKPWLEATGAILFGLFLGILALRTRSIWGGVLVHVSIAFSMDMAALLQTKGLPQQWWP